MFILQVLQVVSAILLIVAILAQQSESNVGSAFGGGEVSESGAHKRRGSEKALFISTIILAAFFVASLVTPFFF
ncbi:MAG: preprotein translocase subunit SecG [Candidatus Kaiserbacteria bacterium]|nr:preprotein translocase subunit SecG [Candidatus Kaiserbacteria bacterium]